MGRQDRSTIRDGSFSDRLVRRLTDSRFRLNVWGGVGVGLAGSVLVVLSDMLLNPSVPLVMPLALVVVFVAWVSTPLASVLTVVLGSSLGSLQSVFGRGMPVTSVTLAVDFMRLSTLAILAFLAYEVRKILEYAETTAVHDQLTGLLNRRGFFELAEREVARSRRDGTPFTVVVMDLDRFKEINDLHGHEAGDAALVRFATHAAGRLRATDVIGRTGGDEFSLVLPLAPDAAAVVISQLIDVPQHEGQPKMRASAGAVSYPHASVSLHAALMAADRRMYEAKQQHAGLSIEVVPE